MPDDVTPEMKQARMKEFMSLLPLTIDLAGLAHCHPDKMFTTDQIEARAISIRLAYKVARNMVKEIGENGI